MRYIGLLITFLLLTSCVPLLVGTYVAAEHSSFTRTDLSVAHRLTPGITKNEAENILGVPIRTEFNNNYETWHYCNTKRNADEYIALYFVRGILAQKQFYTVRGIYGSCSDNIKKGNYREPENIFLTSQLEPFDLSYKLGKGISKSEVLDVMGPPVKSELLKNYEIWHYCNYSMNSNNGNYISIAFVSGKLVEKQIYNADNRFGSCVDNIKTGDYRDFDVVGYANVLYPGMKKSAVIALIGNPAKSEFSDNIEEWHYCNNDVNGDYLALYFDGDILIEKLNYTVSIDDRKGIQDNCSKFIKMGNYRMPDKVLEIKLGN